MPELVTNMTQVTVVDVKMPFASMVTFMIKWAIASIPALLILAMVGLLLGGMLSGAVLALTS